jgi:hypothetical protein
VTLVKRKALALTLMTIPVLSFLFCGLIVPPVDSRSFETIYIRADGSIEGTNKIQRDGDVYIFISDISGSIVVERDNIVLEGSGFILQGTTTNQSTGDWDFVNVNISSDETEKCYRGCMISNLLTRWVLEQLTFIKGNLSERRLHY